MPKKTKSNSNDEVTLETPIDKNLEHKKYQLVRKRDALNSKLHRFKTFLTNSQSITVGSSKYIELDTRLRDLEGSLLSEYSSIQFELEAIDFEQFGEDEEESFESKYYRIISEAKQFLVALSIHPQTHSPMQSSNSNSTNNNSKHSINVKLPSIELPKFSGLYEKWYEFKELYLSLIHTADFIDSVQKFHYLRTSLEGQALLCIKSIDISGQNYDMAWNLLCERYDNKRLIIHKHIKSLFSFSEVKQDSSISIRSLIDDLSKNLRSLENMGVPTDSWDPLIIYLVTSKLDSETIRYWEQYELSNELPTLSELKKFLSSRADYLEKVDLHKCKPKNFIPTSSQVLPKGKNKCFSSSSKGHQHNSLNSNNKFISSPNYTCFYCHKPGHLIYKCQAFLRLSLQEKKDSVKSLKLCFNCLQKNHDVVQCKYGTCNQCSEKHNSLLHPSNERTASNVAHSSHYNSAGGSVRFSQDNLEISNSEPQHSQSHTESQNFSCNFLGQGQVLLATALIEVMDSNGYFHRCKALLDNGSMSNFISNDLAKRLNLNESHVDVSISGVGSCRAHVSRACDIQIKSINSEFQTELYCLIVPSITDNLPHTSIDTRSLSIPSYIKLADPRFYEPSRIDILIGIGLFSKILCNGRKYLGENMPVLQKSKLGWFISGTFGSNKLKNVSCNISNTKDSLQRQVSKFWEIEELTPESSLRGSLSEEEQRAELNFQQTFKRNHEGRFVVSIPLKNPISMLGDSRQIAARQFFALEKRFSSNPNLKARYTEFMEEYCDMGHMSPFDISNESVTYYSPHHAVLREESSTTKLRVVFNSSSPSSSGGSYNSLQMVGPTVQEDLLSILLRFRQHAYVVTADICKMYRQILVADEFKALQLILWRSNPEDNLQTYSLNTVMYGTSSAPFLATRCLKQLAIDNKPNMPRVAKVIERDFYVDDYISGADSVQDLKLLCGQVFSILSSAGFPLRKWKSNSQKILTFLEDNNNSKDTYYFNSSETCKTLGMLWSSKVDSLSFHIDSQVQVKAVTKRFILSEIAKIFDPLGLLGPVVIQAKIILQQLWSLQLGWDEEVPQEIAKRWQDFRSELIELNSLAISRHASCKNSIRIELHGFSDASQSAYGACIYLRSNDSLNNVSVHLLTSKTRVAPLKALSIPKLELCGATLLANLFKKVISSLTCDIQFSCFWCDSTVVLGWIRSSSRNFQVFVGNRISEIQTLTSSRCWRYVPTDQNPADILSRGLTPKGFISSKCWFHGPIWLTKDSGYWPTDISALSSQELPEMRKKVNVFVQSQPEEFFPFHRFSSFTRIQRVMATCLRFIFNCKHSNHQKLSGNLSIAELRIATNKLAELSQKESFAEDIRHLEKSGFVGNKSSLLSLAPFIKDGLIRVGGRLRHSPYSYDKKHPILLSSKHHLTYLILYYEHSKLYHCGPQLLLANIREKYWPISGKNLAKRIVRECILCFRFKPKFVNPIMGDLPSPRVSPSLPFANVGVDFAGPFHYKDRKGRGARHLKCYLCLFICLAIKAVHLELVTDLSTMAFLEAFQRFIARRGKPSNVYSDNGSNFVGANNRLLELGKFLKSSKNDIDVQLGTSLDIKWHFIPAYSPHQGGIWEAGIKSAKHHLLRILTSAPNTLTFESFCTVISQIESVLNSRPLTALSTDPNDFNVLTPSHFLIGRASESLPYQSLENIPTNRLSLYEQLEKIKQLFWKRWSIEYISQLHQRVKWKSNKSNLSVGDMVLIQDNDLPPFKWRLGRVCVVHPGKDGQVRVASINTSSGVIKRSVTKLAPLPIAGYSNS